MYNIIQRLSAVGAFTLSVFFVLLGAVAVFTPFQATSPVAEVSIRTAKIQHGRYGDRFLEYYHSPPADYVFLKFDLEADLSSLFRWNTKQLFVYVVAEYESSKYGVNQIVLWDRIIQSADDAKFKLRGYKNKYAFMDINPRFEQGQIGNISVHWNVVPHVGFMLNYQSDKLTPFDLTPGFV
ncbi:signal peptidase 22 kDa subunit [Basidiobolus meristosporus CBS 931.73]|uniref:Signal peptidase subunit 3 n=1 Tax=Basidiobolus meristosporus CBS 931.73 TaxID=1314790 RepID=A0A1Y1Z4B9_9FUNG|nr:signal peptidase 22 kDa subunit [Basidiobolus meristosporus CBS 931.73]|eukprot:ORY05128.1 signal peptidase 22 kDa subunit [Basidiobolus meristosporus CBS 931.73]